MDVENSKAKKASTLIIGDESPALLSSNHAFNQSKEDLVEIDEEEFDHEGIERKTTEENDSKKLVNNSLETEIQEEEMMLQE